MADSLSSLTPRELAAAVTPLFLLPNRIQHEALNELVIRCEVADRLLASWHADGAPILAEEKQTGFPGSKEGESE